MHKWVGSKPFAGLLLAVALVGSLVGTLVGTSFANAGEERFDFTETHMGVPVKLVLYAPTRDVANNAAQAAYARFAELNTILSDYDPDSDLMRLGRTAGTGAATPVSDDLWSVLDRSQQLAQATDGAFDVTVGPLVRLWRRSRRERELPTPERLADSMRAVGYRSLVLEPSSRSARLLKPGMRLDAGGIGIGYAADEAMKVLKQQGIERALIDASGDVLASDPPPGKEGWRIGIGQLDPDAPPQHFLLLANQAISTAGDAFQFVEIAGRRYSHIVDPRTGLGLTVSSAVTVIAPDCTTADGLDTAVSVLPVDKGLALIEATPGAAAIIVRAEADGVRTYESGRFAGLPWTGEIQTPP